MVRLMTYMLTSRGDHEVVEPPPHPPPGLTRENTLDLEDSSAVPDLKDRGVGVEKIALTSRTFRLWVGVGKHCSSTTRRGGLVYSSRGGIEYKSAAQVTPDNADTQILPPVHPDPADVRRQALKDILPVIEL